MKAVRHIFEYIGIRLGLLLIDSLPYNAAAGMARCLADAWYTFAKARAKIARDNIIRAGITSDEAEADRIARASFHHFAVMVIESLKSDRYFNEGNWQDQVELDIPDKTMELLKKDGAGMILISGHLGNWEVAAQLLSFLKPVTAITRDMNNPMVHKLMLKRKPRNRLTLTPKHGANSARFLSILKEGQVLALLNDQYARDRGVMVDFFGTPASTHAAAPLLHFVTKTPICFGYCVRTDGMKFLFRAGEPQMFKPSGKRQDDVKTVLEAMNRSLEEAIRKYPEQYLWAHRRWK